MELLIKITMIAVGYQLLEISFSKLLQY